MAFVTPAQRQARREAFKRMLQQHRAQQRPQLHGRETGQRVFEYICQCGSKGSMFSYLAEVDAIECPNCGAEPQDGLLLRMLKGR